MENMAKKILNISIKYACTKKIVIVKCYNNKLPETIFKPLQNI